MPRIPLVEDLTSGPIPRGSNLLVEYDPVSQWQNAAVTIAAGWLKTGGSVDYNVTTQPVANIRSRLKSLGLEADALEKEGRLELVDWYTVTLGQKSSERFAQESLKVPDLSIAFSKDEIRHPSRPARLIIRDNASTLARFNDEKSWVEFELTRAVPVAVLHKSIAFRAVIRGIHSDWVYKQLEAGHDGVIDFRLEEEGKTTRDLIRIRSMRNLAFNREWHELETRENFEVILK